MLDKVSISRAELLHPKFKPIIIGFINDVESTLHLKIRITQGARTPAEQDALYAIGRTKQGQNVRPGKPMGDPVTFSPAFASYHNYMIAADCVPFTLDGLSLDWKYDFEKWRPFAQKHGLTMGLDFPSPDPDHLECKFGYNWRDLKHKYEMGEFIPNTNFVLL